MLAEPAGQGKHELGIQLVARSRKVGPTRVPANAARRPIMVEDNTRTAVGRRSLRNLAPCSKNCAAAAHTFSTVRLFAKPHFSDGIRVVECG